MAHPRDAPSVHGSFNNRYIVPIAGYRLCFRCFSEPSPLLHQVGLRRPEGQHARTNNIVCEEVRGIERPSMRRCVRTNACSSSQRSLPRAQQLPVSSTRPEGGDYRSLARLMAARSSSTIHRRTMSLIEFTDIELRRLGNNGNVEVQALARNKGGRSRSCHQPARQQVRAHDQSLRQREENSQVTVLEPGRRHKSSQPFIECAAPVRHTLRGHCSGNSLSLRPIQLSLCAHARARRTGRGG